MPLRMPPISRYFETLALLKDALKALDELGESIAAAHLCTVIDIVSAKVGHDNTSPH